MGRLALSFLVVVVVTGLFVAAAHTGHAAPSSPYTCEGPQNGSAIRCSGMLQPNLPWPLVPLDAYARNTSLTLGVNANVSLHAYVVDQNQYNGLTSTGKVTSSLYNFSGGAISEKVVLQARGFYYVVLYTKAAASFNATISLEPIAPPFPSKPPAPTGIADYGIANESGNIIAYSDLSSEVAGSAVINSIKAFNQYPPIGVNQYAASLQMNVMLEANLTTGSSRAYWLQNVISFETNNLTLYFSDEIFNFSSSNSVLAGVRGSGGPPNTMGGYEYTLYPPASYAHPLKVQLVISVAQLNGEMLVRFGYSNGSLATAGRYHYYDNVTISEPGVSASGILVSGHRQTPNSQFYDAELVFAGGGNLAATNFIAMNSTLGMRYLLTNETWVSPRAVYSFGAVTGEGAYNLRTSMVNGTLVVTTGQPDFSVSYIESPAPQTITITTTATAPPTSTATISSTSTSTQSATGQPTIALTSSATQSSTPAGQPGNLLESIPEGLYIGAGIAIAGIAIAVGIARGRRRATK